MVVGLAAMTGKRLPVKPAIRLIDYPVAASYSPWDGKGPFGSFGDSILDALRLRTSTKGRTQMMTST
jgi:hypothetical protein